MIFLESPPRSVFPDASTRFATTCTAAGLVLAVLLATPAFAQPALTVEWRNERVSVRASEALLSTAVAEVSRRSGIEVVGLEKLTGRLTVEFADLEPGPALAAMLTGVNYVLAAPQAPQAVSKVRLVLYVHSMAPGAPVHLSLDGPIDVPTLESIAALDVGEEGADADDEETGHPEMMAEQRDRALEISDLAAEGAFGPGATIDSLAERLNEGSVPVRVAAVNALALRPGTRVLGLVTEALGDDAAAVREAAVAALGRATDPASLAKIGELLAKHPNRYVRIGALRVLASRASQASAPSLQAVDDDPDRLIRDAAVQILAELGRRRDARADTAGGLGTAGTGQR